MYMSQNKEGKCKKAIKEIKQVNYLFCLVGNMHINNTQKFKCIEIDKIS